MKVFNDVDDLQDKYEKLLFAELGYKHKRLQNLYKLSCKFHKGISMTFCDWLVSFYYYLKNVSYEKKEIWP